MTGIYIHIPFCKQACSYCDFHFSTSQKQKTRLVESIIQEIDLRAVEVNTPIKSIYFGGGTPSILNKKELHDLFECLDRNFDLSALEETTLETNPDDHNPDNLKQWKALGIDRLSIGIQSFINRDLTLMNRAHNAQEALKCVKQAKDAGFDKLTIDLIYGIPHQSRSEWLGNVEIAMALETDHISAYCLTIEDKTALHHQIKTGALKEKTDQEIEWEFTKLRELLESADFEHYEISNFAKRGKKAIHNSHYWSRLPYIGFGPSAHSFDGIKTRKWNISNNPIYIKKITDGEIFHESEQLDCADVYNETLMTRLRTKDGLSFDTLNDKEALHLKTSINDLAPAQKSQLKISEKEVCINPNNWLTADAIIRELMI